MEINVPLSRTDALAPGPGKKIPSDLPDCFTIAQSLTFDTHLTLGTLTHTGQATTDSFPCGNPVF